MSLLSASAPPKKTNDEDDDKEIKVTPEPEQSPLGSAMEKPQPDPNAPLGKAAPDDTTAMRALGLDVPVAAPAPRYAGPNVGKTAPAPGQAISDAALPQDSYRFQKDQITQRKIAAAGKGDLVGLGAAKVAEAELDRANPYGSAANHPGIMGKIEHGLAKAGNIAGDIFAPSTMALIPGTDLNRGAREQAGLGEIRIGEENLKDQAETRNLNAEADSRLTPKIPKLLTGEENIRTNTTTGERERAWELPSGAVQWAPEGQVPGQSPLGSAVSSASPAGTAFAPSSFTYGKATPENMPADVTQFSSQAKAAFVDAKGKPLVTPGQIDAEVKALGPNPTQKMMADAYNKLQGLAQEHARENEAEQQRLDSGVRSEQREEAKEQRVQDRKDMNTVVYAEDPTTGQTILTNKYDAQKNGQPWEEASRGDINKDRQAVRQLNDVQLNTSRYTKAANDAAAKPPTKRDYVDMHSILNKAGALDLNIAIGEGGSIKVPVLTSLIEGLNREVNSEAYAELSPQGKALIDGYIRSLSAIPAYQKALTGIGRSNKEMLDLELQNIPNPTMAPGDIQRKLGQFQENIDRATEGFPKLPGLKSPQQTRAEAEGTAPKKGDTRQYQDAQYKFVGHQWVKQ